MERGQKINNIQEDRRRQLTLYLDSLNIVFIREARKEESSTCGMCEKRTFLVKYELGLAVSIVKRKVLFGNFLARLNSCNWGTMGKMLVVAMKVFIEVAD